MNGISDLEVLEGLSKPSFRFPLLMLNCRKLTLRSFRLLSPSIVKDNSVILFQVPSQARFSYTKQWKRTIYTGDERITTFDNSLIFSWNQNKLNKTQITTVLVCLGGITAQSKAKQLAYNHCCLFSSNKLRSPSCLVFCCD